MALRTEAALRLEQAKMRYNIKRSPSGIKVYIDGDLELHEKSVQIDDLKDFNRALKMMEKSFNKDQIEDAIRYANSCWQWTERLDKKYSKLDEDTKDELLEHHYHFGKLIANLEFFTNELVFLLAEALLDDDPDTLVIDKDTHQYYMAKKYLASIIKWGKEFRSIYREIPFD